MAGSERSSRRRRPGPTQPVIRGWAEYYRRVVAMPTFSKLDDWMYHRSFRHARSMHPAKPWGWLAQRYWGRLNKGRQDRWVFGETHTGHHLLKFRWFGVIRHPAVRGRSSPDDPSLREYWWGRRSVHADRLSASVRRLAVSQDWRCRVCGQGLLNGEELQRHHRQPKSQGGSEARSNRELIHLYCHQQETYRQFHGRGRGEPAEEQL